LMSTVAQVEELLSGTKIGVLAVRGLKFPLVNPAAFHFGGGSVWMTTSRHAIKIALARRNPRAAFLATGQENAVVIQGQLEAYDPLTVSGPLRAALDVARVAPGLLGYGIKNAPFLAGYLMDLASVPSRWWPQHRVMLRLRAGPTRIVKAPLHRAVSAELVPMVPEDLGRALAAEAMAYLSWQTSPFPMLLPALWAIAGRDAFVWITDDRFEPPNDDEPGAVLVNRNHPYRAGEMLGACFRGLLRLFPGARKAVAARYALNRMPNGFGLRLTVQRTEWWRGFQTGGGPVQNRVG
jgi:hypothetical protein